MANTDKPLDDKESLGILSKILIYALSLISIIIAMAIGRSIVTGIFGTPKTETMTKTQYLEAVRKRNVDDPNLIVCIYDKYIDRHGVPATLKLDLKYSRPEDAQNMPDTTKKELAEIASDCARKGDDKGEVQW